MVTTCIFPKLCNPCRIMNFWSTRMAGINLPNLNFDVKIFHQKRFSKKNLHSKKCFENFPRLKAFGDFTMGFPIVKSPKAVRYPKIGEKKSKHFFEWRKNIFFEKCFWWNFFTSKFRFGRLIPAILVDQKFIILQGLHILGKIQVATPPQRTLSITVFISHRG